MVPHEGKSDAVNGELAPQAHEMIENKINIKRQNKKTQEGKDE